MFKFGTILKPVGLKGEVRVFSDSDFLEQRLIKAQTFQTSKGPLTVHSATLGSNVHKVKFVEITSIEQAENYRNIDLMLDELSNDYLSEDEYYIPDLMNCIVYENEQEIGQVIEVIDYVAHPVLRIETDSGSFLCPFVKQFVINVNPKEKRIDVKLIEGMR